MQQSVRRALRRPRAVVGTAALALALTAALGGTASAAPAPDGVVASGSDWSVTAAAGGYVVSLNLDAPLPVKNDAPELVVNGSDLGLAQESPDGTTLSIATADPAVARADAVTWRWASGDAGTANPPAAKAARAAASPAATAPPATTAPPAGPDPLAHSTGAYTVADYNFGTASIPLANLGGHRGELEGRVYLPAGKGEHPLVVFLHGRHSSCYNLTTLRGTSGWPCPAGTAPILSYAGYDGAGDALAAAGYTVVSISANSINAFDGSFGADAGAVARGQLILDSLTMLQKANAGKPVVYHDATTDADVTLDQALAAGQATHPTATTLRAANLKGTMDFSDIGVMGHSRGGEGAVTAGNLNEGLAHPFDIKSIFALAPIDFTRATLPDVITTTLLPYCDGDVSDQQGQHFYADSREAFSDDVARSDIWVMGTDHDFYNSSWTPPYPGASDDWSASDDSVCGTSDPAKASPDNIRLSAAQQYAVGTEYLTGFFELTLGGHKEFQSMFDGSGVEPSSVASFADVRTVAQQPAADRADIADFAATSKQITTSGTATAAVCASKYGRTLPPALPTCTSTAVGLTSQAQPYWTPANYQPNVPLNQLTHLTWTDGTGALTVALTSGQRDVSKYRELVVNASPDESVATGTGLTLTVTDTRGHAWSSPLSDLNPWTVRRMPGSTSTLLHKLVLQQAHVPTATLAKAGLDTHHLASIRFTAGVGADGTASGGEYLQDLVFDTPAMGTPRVHERPTVNVASTAIEEGGGPGTAQVAVYLSGKSSTPVSAYLSVIGSTTTGVGLAMRQVTFEPGQTCQTVTVPTLGNTTPSATATTSYKVAVGDTTNAVLGTGDFGTITVREDDGLTGGGPLAPPVGTQGNACAEFTALAHPGKIKTTGVPVRVGAALPVTATGFRAGESVTLTLGGAPLGSAVADAHGRVSIDQTVPAGTPTGQVPLTATGIGSGYTATGKVHVK
ncbi:hypothetical protein GCM10023322_59070 [Rugosimonospora acidiphila]|uniref:Alpha/beta hydrolase n=1 Tax=Rugosimonospora acidiphila TaxID=556531 RepID=A0ABP9SDF5_9ACTN